MRKCTKGATGAVAALLALWGTGCASTEASRGEAGRTEYEAGSVAVSTAAERPGVAAAERPVSGIDVANFDRSVRPQDDFYRYVNGGWIDRETLPPDLSALGAFTELHIQAEKDLRAIVEEAAARTDARPGSDAQKVGALYRSFMDTARIEALGMAPIEADLARVRALRDHAGLPALMGELGRLGVQRPILAGVTIDGRETSRHRAFLRQAGLGLPDRDYYFRDDEATVALRASYRDYIATLLGLAGLDGAERRADDIVTLETRIAEHHWTNVQNRDRNATYNKLTRAEAAALIPQLDLDAYLEAAGLGSADVVLVAQPSYLEGLGPVIAGTPIETWRDYFTFKTIDDAAPMLSRPFVDAHFAFQGRAVRGIQENRARWKRGVALVSGSLPDVLGRLYVERHFPPEAKAGIEALVGNLLLAFDRGIDGLEWMTPATRTEAKAKLAKFTPKVGYPDRWKDYSALEIAEGDLMPNLRRVHAFDYQDMLDDLHAPVDRTEWAMPPFMVNAYYSPPRNEIGFPAAILQPPFFNLAADDAVNYGAIGAVIGHEISHGFDDQGRKSDGDGNLRDWWTEEDVRAFEARARRIEEQFAAFEALPGLHLNGQLTLGENIGDLSGIAVAYSAYRLSLDGAEPPVIDGFTGDQRFFLGYAQVWRSIMTDEALRHRVLTDPHSPARFRVMGPLPNFEPFYEAFDVRPGDAMYRPPEERIRIW